MRIRRNSGNGSIKVPDETVVNKTIRIKIANTVAVAFAAEVKTSDSSDEDDSNSEDDERNATTASKYLIG